MHQPIRERLEAHLAGKADSQFDTHLAACTSCRDEVMEIKRQNDMLRLLRVDEQLEPAPGFYARVMDRIEAQRRQSMWYAFLEPLFAKRLVYASLTLLVLLSGFLLSTPSEEVSVASASPEQILTEEEVHQIQLVDQEKDRDAVLVHLASY
jgi:predicted anti-sigma-YlaC factor YlaD